MAHATVARAQCASVSVGANVDVSIRAGNESESAVAIDPTNPNRIFVASNVDSGSVLFGAYSTNGGTTWNRRNVATGSDGLAAACCDPTVAWDSFGNLFLCYINSAGSAIVVGVSTNGGQSFTSLTTFTGSIDQPTITTGAGMVWVTYNSSGSIVARGATVTGLGTVSPFGSAQSAPSSSGGNFGDIAIGPGGQIMVTYQSPSSGEGPSTIYVNTDADGVGAGGFGARVTVTSTNVGGFDFIPAQSSRSVDAEAGLAWDRTGGVHNGRVYLMYNDESPAESNNLDIWVRFSDTNGTTWSSPVRVNNDSTTRSQFLPRIALDQTTGYIAVTWYDCRNDAGTIGGGFSDTTVNNEAQFFGTISTDGGLTFLPNVQISTGVSKASTAMNVIDLGDYTALAYQSGKFFPVWADNSPAISANPNLPRLDLVTAAVTVGTGPATPTNAVANPPAVCAGQSATLSAMVGSGETADWFTTSCGGTPISGGASPVVMPTMTTTYYVRARNTTTGCLSASCATVAVMVNNAPEPPSNAMAMPSRICPGQPTVLSATVGLGRTVEWFTESCGGTAVPGGANPTVMPTGTTTYYARARNMTTNCVSATCASVTVTDASHTGDFDGGGVGLSDLPTFISILLSPGTSQDCIADMNNDGSADGLDIQPWVNAL